LLSDIGKTVLLKALLDPIVLDLPEVQLKPLLKDASLQGVVYNDDTKWPIGFDKPPSAVYKE
jgi:hypothetical protein